MTIIWKYGALLLACAIAMPAAAQDGELAPAIAALGEVMHKADALEKEGRIQQAEPLWRDALKKREQLIGATSPTLVPGQSRLARNLEAQARYRDAEVLRRASINLLQHDPAEWEALAEGRSALGYNLMMQGQFSEAAEQSYAALELWREANRAEDLDATQALSTVGLVLNKQGRSAEAEPFYRRALAIRQAALGESDLDTATSYNNLAAALNTQGKLEEADGYFRRAFAIRQENGTVPALVAQNAFNIAMNLNKQGKWVEAESFFRQSIEMWTQTFGANHVQTAAGYNGLGMNYYRQDRAEVAEDYFRRALKIREKTLGKYHPDVAESYGNLGLALRALGREKKARKLLTQAFDISERTAGADHPDTQALRAALEAQQLPAS